MGGYKKHLPTVYLVHWPEIGVTKAGYTEKQRWRTFQLRGAELLGLFEFPEHRAAFALEDELDRRLKQIGERAFDLPTDGEPYLGCRGDGYLECWRVSLTDAQAMLAGINQAMLNAEPSNARTYGRTNATNARFQDQGITPHLPNAAGAVDNTDSSPADVYFATICPDDLSGWELRLCRFHQGQGRMPRPKGQRVMKPLRDDYQRVTDELRESVLVRGGNIPNRDRQLEIAMAAVPRKKHTTKENA